MPITEDGRRVDLLLNLLAIINRTTSMPLYEIAITSICHQVRERMKTMSSYDDKEKILFDIMYQFNEVEHERMWNLYLKMDENEKKDFIDDAVDNGIYIHQSPLWETKPLFYRVSDVLKKYPWLGPDTLYVKKWGCQKRVLNKIWIGQMYIMKLKQSDRRGFSARSTGAVDTKGLPTRSYKSRSHLEQNSGTAIRFGEFETLNFSIGILPQDIALFHAMYRTSIKGRRDLARLAFESNTSEAIQTIDNSYTSRVAEIFNVILKSLGIGINFIDEEESIYPLNNSNMEMHELDGNTYFCSDYQFYLIQRMNDIRKEILEENPIITSEELEKRIEHEMRTRDYIMGPLYDDDGELTTGN